VLVLGSNSGTRSGSDFRKLFEELDSGSDSPSDSKLNFTKMDSIIGCLVDLYRSSVVYQELCFVGVAYRSPVLTCGSEDDLSWLRREPNDGLRQ
jgi:hypothetical protein